MEYTELTNPPCLSLSQKSSFKELEKEYDKAVSTNPDKIDSTPLINELANSKITAETKSVDVKSRVRETAEAEKHGRPIIWEKTGNEKIDTFIEKRNNLIEKKPIHPIYRKDIRYTYNERTFTIRHGRWIYEYPGWY